MGRPRKSPAIRSSRVICYTRVSTDEQANSGLGLGAQRAKLESECAYRGWTDALFIEDAGHSAKSLDRPGITRALELLSSNNAGVLMVAKLDRLSRSVIDFANLMDLANQQGWLLVVLDLGVDMTTATGRMVAGIMAQLAQWEREQIGERTRAALAVKRAQGAKLGRPVSLPSEIREFIIGARAEGFTLTAIAETLNSKGIATAQNGRKWYASTISAVLASA